MQKLWPGPRYEVRSTFQAPLSFVYRWCTDYTPKDARYSREGYDRRILQRSHREVIFEDLYDTKKGWIWMRRVVRLLPPDRWHADSVGSDRALSVDYRLSKLPGNHTQLTIRARRRPYGIGLKNPPKSQWERSVATNWRRFGRALERDYKRDGAKRTRK
jgi:hypothetical protein